MMKFCCDKFQFFYSGETQTGLNIRVVKPKFDKTLYSKLFKSDDLSFFITEGYVKNDSPNKLMVIQYCPFCGGNLKRFYKDDKYINEDWQLFSKIVNS